MQHLRFLFIALVLLCFTAASASNVITLPYDSVIGVDMTPRVPYSKELAKVAGKGDARAMIDLGDCYFTGAGVKQDAKKAAEFYEKVTKQKNVDPQLAEEAYRKEARCYFDWDGVEKDHRKLVKIYEKAVKEKNRSIAHTLLDIYLSGYSDKPNYNAFRMMLTLADEEPEYLPYVIVGYITGDAGVAIDGDAASKYIEVLRQTPLLYDEVMPEIVKIGHRKAGKLKRSDNMTMYKSTTDKILDNLIGDERTEAIEEMDREYAKFSAEGIHAKLYQELYSSHPVIKSKAIMVILFGDPAVCVKDMNRFTRRGEREKYEGLIKEFYDLWLEYAPESLLNYVQQKGFDELPGMKDTLRAFIYTPEGKKYKNEVESILRSR
ncbi:MAG: sel1 repeat family protein [Muribaculaceae bacterium]|nr:sel1 repeat family protein [Muribaculaceae bacterium]